MVSAVFYCGTDDLEQGRAATELPSTALAGRCERGIRGGLARGAAGARSAACRSRQHSHTDRTSHHDGDGKWRARPAEAQTNCFGGARWLVARRNSANCPDISSREMKMSPGTDDRVSIAET